jgi:F-type H+-transporting ATPase subunit alpha
VREPRSLSESAREALSALTRTSGEQAPELDAREVGWVTSVGQGVAWVGGLSRIRSEELVTIGAGVLGLALDILSDSLGVVLLGGGRGLAAGDEVVRSGQVLSVPVGESLLGRVLDPMGQPLDGRGPVRFEERWPVSREAPPIIARAPVEVPLATGLKVVDALIPIGRGQRELILGDRQSGKTAIAEAAIVNQKGSGVVCVYCAIGQRSAGTARVIERLRRAGALDYTLVVVVAGEDEPGLQYVAPYAATTMAEFFMARGRDVLVVYDDLTRHARAYRELSLLLRRPPGREAFPGDIFYIHSRLLERATHLAPGHGGGSLTALPIIETEAQNLSAYIPTNLISITDGQIYVNPDLFQKAVLPAVDVGRSVSRVGGKAQLPAYRKVAGDLKLAYSQFQELESFSRFGTRLDDRTRAKLEHGRRVREVLKQGEFDLLSPAEQIAILYAVAEGLFDPLPLAQLEAAQAHIVSRLRGDAQLAAEVVAAEPDSGLWERLSGLLAEILREL